MLVSVDLDSGAVEIAPIGLDCSWYLGRRRNCCPGVSDSDLFFSSVLIFVPLRFVKFRNLTSVLNGWLDAPRRRGLLGRFSAEFCFWVWRYTSFLRSSRPQGALCRCSGHPSPLSQFWSGLDRTSNKHTHMYLHYTQVLQIPRWTSFFQYLLFTVWQKIV